jgi:hypothetical protein
LLRTAWLEARVTSGFCRRGGNQAPVCHDLHLGCGRGPDAAESICRADLQTAARSEGPNNSHHHHHHNNNNNDNAITSNNNDDDDENDNGNNDNDNDTNNNTTNTNDNNNNNSNNNSSSSGSNDAESQPSCKPTQDCANLRKPTGGGRKRAS